MKRIVKVFLYASALVLASCAGNSGSKPDADAFAGVWHEAMPVGMPETVNVIQGFVLEKDGCAASVGMSTLQYRSWKMFVDSNDALSLVMSGESIGNGQTVSFSDTMQVVSLVRDTLVLGRGESYRIKYVRQSSTSDVQDGNIPHGNGNLPMQDSSADPDVIMAEFTGCDGEMLTVEFHSREETATVTFGGREYVLSQYVTASGYGYADSVIDIRGKGREMHLTFKASGRTLEFTEK